MLKIKISIPVIFSCIILCSFFIGKLFSQEPETSSENPETMLTIEQVVQNALQNNRGYRSQSRSIQTAESEIRTARLLPNPILNLSHNYMALNRSNSHSSIPESQVSVNQTFYFSGQRSSRIALAERMRRMTEMGFLDLERNFRLQIRLACWNLIYRRKLLEFKESFLKNYQELIRLNEIRLSKGDISELDYKKLLLERSKYKKGVDEEARNVIELKNSLQASAGLGETGTWDIAGTFDIPEITEVLDIADTEKLEHRSDLMAAISAVEAARANIRLQESLAYPEIGIGFNYQHQPAADGYRPNDYVGVSLSAPLKIFDRNQGYIEGAKNELVRRELELEHARTLARSDIQNQRVSLETDYKILKDYEENNRINQDVYEKFRFMYLRGATGLVNLLDSERSYNEIQQTYLEQMFLAITDVEIYRASIEILDAKYHSEEEE